MTWSQLLMGIHILNFNRCCQIVLPKLASLNFHQWCMRALDLHLEVAYVLPPESKLKVPVITGIIQALSSPPQNVSGQAECWEGWTQTRGSLSPISQVVTQVTQPSPKKRQGYFGRGWAPHHYKCLSGGLVSTNAQSIYSVPDLGLGVLTQRCVRPISCLPRAW